MNTVISFLPGFIQDKHKERFHPSMQSSHCSIIITNFTNSFESEFDAWGSVEQGDKLPYIAPHQLVLNAGLEHQKFTFNISTKYTDVMRTFAGQGTMAFNERTDASFIIDSSFQYNFSWKLSAFASAYNITNVNYIVSRRPAGVRPGLPRTFTIGVKANF